MSSTFGTFCFLSGFHALLSFIVIYAVQQQSDALIIICVGFALGEKLDTRSSSPRCRFLIMKAPVAVGLAVGIAFVVLFSTIKLSSGVGNVDGAVFTMERTMCFGTCPSHSLAIHGNRTVNYEGFAFVAESLVATPIKFPKRRLSNSRAREFHRINYYFSLEDTYEESQ
jgi:hypothetical protein